MLGLTFPPINELIRWRDIFPTFNKVALIAVLAALIGIGIFLLAGRKDPLKAPTGVRNLAETGVEFIEDRSSCRRWARRACGWTPFLLSLFIFIYLCNLPGIIPIFQMPATARMAIPLFLALLVWVVYNVVGFKHNGIKYITGMAWPHGVPVGMQPAGRRHRVAVQHRVAALLAGRPTLRQHARRPHAARSRSRFLSDAMFHGRDEPVRPATRWASCRCSCCVFLTAFEVLVGFLQAYIFIILTAVFINAAQHPEH